MFWHECLVLLQLHCSSSVCKQTHFLDIPFESFILADKRRDYIYVEKYIGKIT